MILDTNLLLLEDTSVAAAAGIATVTNVIDLSSREKNLGAGETLYAIITITTTFTSGGSATVDFRICTDAQDPIATDGTARIVGASGPKPFATLIAGTRLIIPLQSSNTVGWQRYLGVNIVTAVATTTAGKVSIEIMSGVPDAWVAHADAVN